jgi:protoheme IX farnesyltransferase
VLAAVLVIWQIPHSLALAWLYREHYIRAGFRVLPAVDRARDMTSVVVLLYSLALLPIGLAAALAGMAGWVYAIASVLLGAALLAFGVNLYRRRTEASARRLFLASIVYLPALLGVMTLDRGPIVPPLNLAGRAAAVDVADAAPDAQRTSAYDATS